jgi:hypothetical protein
MRGGGEAPRPPRCVFLLQQREDRTAALVNVELRILLLGIESAAEEIHPRQLRTEQDLIDAVILAPAVGVHRGDLPEQIAHVLAAFEHRGHRVVGEALIKAMVARAAGRNRVCSVAPLVVLVRERAQCRGRLLRVGREHERGCE